MKTSVLARKLILELARSGDREMELLITRLGRPKIKVGLAKVYQSVEGRTVIESEEIIPPQSPVVKMPRAQVSFPPKKG